VIPLLGVPVLNREDLAARMVASIDYPVDELLVVVNAENKRPTVDLRQSSADIRCSWQRPFHLVRTVGFVRFRS